MMMMMMMMNTRWWIWFCIHLSKLHAGSPSRLVYMNGSSGKTICFTNGYQSTIPGDYSFHGLSFPVNTWPVYTGILYQTNTNIPNVPTRSKKMWATPLRFHDTWNDAFWKTRYLLLQIWLFFCGSWTVEISRGYTCVMSSPTTLVKGCL